MFTKLNKANGYYAGKSYGTFQTGTTKTEDKTTVQTIKETITGNGEKSNTLKWVIIIAVIAVGGYFLYKHYKH